MWKRVHCRPCGDSLTDAPSGVDTCRKHSAWIAQQRGDMLTEAEARDLELLAFLCAFEVGLEKGLEEVPEID